MLSLILDFCTKIFIQVHVTVFFMELSFTCVVLPSASAVNSQDARVLKH